MADLEIPPFKASDLESPTAADRSWGLLSHLSVLAMPLVPCLGPFIMYKLAEKRGSLFKRFHSLQAFYFHGGVSLFGWIAWPLSFLLCGLHALSYVLLLIAPICGIFAAYQALRGNWYNYPIAGAMARMKLGVPSMLGDDLPDVKSS